MSTASAPSHEEDNSLLCELLEPANEAVRQRVWRHFADRFSRLIAGCVRRALQRYGAPCRTEDIDDLIGEVWVALLHDDLRRLRAFDPARGCRLSTFLGLLATNLTIDKLRRARHEAMSLSDLSSSHRSLSVGESMSAYLEHRQHADLAKAALAQLSETEQAFVAEVFCEERDPAELARELNINTTTVYTRKLKVRAKLRKLLDGRAA